jgi:FPC/CPF motif-containing protein YcgG
VRYLKKNKSTTKRIEDVMGEEFIIIVHSGVKTKRKRFRQVMVCSYGVRLWLAEDTQDGHSGVRIPPETAFSRVFLFSSTKSLAGTRGKTNGRWKQYSGRDFPVLKTRLFPLLPTSGKPKKTNGSDCKPQGTPQKRPGNPTYPDGFN